MSILNWHLLLTVLLLLPAFTTGEDVQGPSVFQGPVYQELHDPILITDDSGFNSTNGVSAGSGTPDDPFIIRDLVIENLDYLSWCIEISDTTSHVIIENCTLRGEGIRLCRSSGVKIEDINITHASTGISLNLVDNIAIMNVAFPFFPLFRMNCAVLIEGAEDIVISDCDINSSGYGIYIAGSAFVEKEFSSNITIENNYFGWNTNAMEISDITDLKIINNSIDNFLLMAVHFTDINDLALTENRIFANNDQIGWWNILNAIEDTTNLIVERNYFYNKFYSLPLLGISGCTNGSITDNTFSKSSGLGVGSSSNISVSNNLFTENGFGTSITESENISLSGNFYRSCSQSINIAGSRSILMTENSIEATSSGVKLADTRDIFVGSNIIIARDLCISLKNSVHNRIGSNSIMNSTLGLELKRSNNNIITSNIIKGNSLGIELNESMNSTIINNLISNEINYRDILSHDLWFSERTAGSNIVGGPFIGGNYWSDYRGEDKDGDGIGDTNLPYGPGDFLPLIIIPGNFTLIDRSDRNPRTGEVFNIEVQVNDTYPWVPNWSEFRCTISNIFHETLYSEKRIEGDFPDPPVYKKKITIPAGGARINYRFTIRDIYGHSQELSWEGPVDDVLKPKFDSLITSELVTGESAWVRVWVHDNIDVSSVRITPWKNNAQPQRESVQAKLRITNDDEYWEIDLDVENDASRYMFEVVITDTSGLVTRNTTQYLKVLDSISPEVGLEKVPPNVSCGTTVEILFRITDNIFVEKVKASSFISDIEHNILVWDRKNGIYSIELFIPHLASHVSIKVEACDPSDNNGFLEFYLTPDQVDVNDILVLISGIPETGKGYKLRFQLQDKYNYSVLRMRVWFNDILLNIQTSEDLEKVLVVPEDSRIMNVEIELLDGSANSRKVELVLNVTDIIDPVITAVFDPPQNGENLRIYLVRTDNIDVVETGISVYQRGEGWIDLQVVPGGFFLYNVPTDMDELEFEAWAIDGAGNTGTDHRTVEIIDVIPPYCVKVQTSIITTNDTRVLDLEVETTDNRDIDIVRIDVNSSVGWCPSNHLFNTHDSIYAVQVQIPLEVRSFTYSIYIQDEGGNYFRTDKATVQLDKDDGKDPSGHPILCILLAVLSIPILVLLSVTFVILMKRRTKVDNMEG